MYFSQVPDFIGPKPIEPKIYPSFRLLSFCSFDSIDCKSAVLGVLWFSSQSPDLTSTLLLSLTINLIFLGVPSITIIGFGK